MLGVRIHIESKCDVTDCAHKRYGVLRADTPPKFPFTHRHMQTRIYTTHISTSSSTQKLISRVQSFGRYMFDLSQYPVAESLFASDKFIQAAKDVCPEGAYTSARVCLHVCLYVGVRACAIGIVTRDMFEFDALT